MQTLVPNTVINFNQANCTVEFHTVKEMLTVTSEVYNTVALKETRSGWTEGLNNSLLQCSTDKSLASPFGTFSVTLAHVRDANGRSWLDAISPLDLVVIRMASASTTAEGDTYRQIPIMVGIVEGIRRDSNYSGVPQQTIIVDGSDFGKFLFDYKIYYRYLFDLSGLAIHNLGRDIAPVGTMYSVLYDLYTKEFLYRSLLQFKFNKPNQSRLKELKYIVETDKIITDKSSVSMLEGDIAAKQKQDLEKISGGQYKLKEMLGFAFGYSDGWLPGYGGFDIPENSVWDTLGHYANTDFHELFFDLVDMELLNGGSKRETGYMQMRETENNRTHKHRIPLMMIDDRYVLMLIHRPKPFISQYGDTTVGDATMGKLGSRHFGLPYITLKDSWVKHEDLSVTSHEVYNHFGTNMSLLQSAMNGDSTSSTNPSPVILCEILNRNSIYRYGQRRFVASTYLYPDSSKQDVLDNVDEETKVSEAAMIALSKNSAGPMAYLTKQNNLLHDWYIYNDQYRTGQFELQGHPGMKIGTVVKQREPSETGEKLWNYYVQNVSHTFVKYSGYTTTISVIRGFDENEILMPPDLQTNSNSFLEVTEEYIKNQYLKNGKAVLKHSKEGFEYLKRLQQKDFTNTGSKDLNDTVLRDDTQKQEPLWNSPAEEEAYKTKMKGLAEANENVYAKEYVYEWDMNNKLLFPVNKPWTITSPFGPRVPPNLNASPYHNGIDIGVKTGTPVFAVADGIVVYDGYGNFDKEGYGTYVQINHGNGNITTYAHLKRITVNPTQRVKVGDLIALSGNSGNSTGPHLHFQLYKGVHGYVNPMDYFGTSPLGG